MASRADEVQLPAPLPRWWLPPVLGRMYHDLVTAALERLRPARPAVPPMSASWLAEHERHAQRDLEL